MLLGNFEIKACALIPERPEKLLEPANGLTQNPEPREGPRRFGHLEILTALEPWTLNFGGLERHPRPFGGL